jgi:hypothetical protein
LNLFNRGLNKEGVRKASPECESSISVREVGLADARE